MRTNVLASHLVKIVNPRKKEKKTDRIYLRIKKSILIGKKCKSKVRI